MLLISVHHILSTTLASSDTITFMAQFSAVINNSAVQEGAVASYPYSPPSSPPTEQVATMATITFKCEMRDDKLEVVVLSCNGLPDLDGASNLTDAYVVVKIGSGKDKPQKTKAVWGSQDPEFDAETSTFQFDVRS